LESITILQTTIHWPGDVIFEVTSVLHIPTASNIFNFVSANDFGYLVIAHPSKIETHRINMKSQAIAKMEDLIIDGKPEVMKKFKNSVTILVDEKKLLVLKFAGLNGMQVEVAINLNNSPVKTYTFYSIAPFGNRRILITEDGDALYLYSTTPTLDEYKSYTIVVNGMIDPVISGIYKFFERLNARSTYKHETKDLYLYYSKNHVTSSRWMIESGTKYLDLSSRNTPDGLIYAVSTAFNPEDVAVEDWTNNGGGVEISVIELGYLVPRNLDLECRYPEAGDEFKEDPYCAISLAHSMCRFSGPNPECDILHRGLTTEQKTVLTDKLNEYRSQIADGSLSDKVPEAANMRKIFWSDELARLAEMWASQCSSSLENIRSVLGEDEEYAQNIVRFEFNTEKDVSEYQMEEVVKYWFTSIGDNFEENKDLISEFNIDTKDANLGYFTQLAWAKTFKIGCGWSQYRSRPGGSISVVVCNYLEHGNKPGQEVYSIGTKCTNCGDGYVCGDDGTLCVKV